MRTPPRYDLHLHSRHSPDSLLEVVAIAGHVQALGLAGFALTDHNSVAGHADLARLHRLLPGLVVLPGVEVSAREGHVLAYGVAEAPPKGRPATETVEWVTARGGVAVLAHPFRFWHGVGGSTIDRLSTAGVEVLNGHTSAAANSRAARTAGRPGRPQTGGSDAHALRDIGRAYTETLHPAASEEALLDALRAGEVRAGGRSASMAEAASLAVRSGLRRIARGLRAV